MRIVQSERHIQRRTQVGRIVPWVGIGILAVGWALSLLGPEWILAVGISLPIGVGVSILGGYYAERYAGPLAHHKTLAQTLKGLDDNHVLLNYVLPAPHVLFDPSGFTVFVVKTVGGTVECDGERWKHRQRGKFFRQLAGQQSLGLPQREARADIAKLEEWLEETTDVEDELEQMPVRAAIIFVHPNVQVEADDSPVPALYWKKFRGWLRGPGNRRPLSRDVYQQLAAAVDEEISEQKADEAGEETG
jgi:hypothetical protein